MFIVLTEETLVPKVQYVVDEFSRIQGLKSTIELRLVENVSDILASENALFYSPDPSPPDKNSLKYNWGKPITESDYEHIIANNISEYDVIWLAFCLLSRNSEYQSELNGHLIRSYSNRVMTESVLKFDKPYVNYIFNSLAEFLTISFSNILFEDGKEPIVELSHDLDYLKKTPQLRIKQSMFNFYNLFKKLTGEKSQNVSFAGNLKFLLSNSEYWMFDYWQEIEETFSMKSIFYVYAKSKSLNDFRSWLIDPSYDIKSDKLLQKQLIQLHMNGFSIGLHGGIKSATSFEQLKTEKEILQDSLGIEIVKTRQHWLTYEEQITPYIHEKLFKEDSTIGWNNQMGFRSGVASRYRPFDHHNDRPFEYFIIPQIIMDSHLYDYNSKGLSEGINLASTLLGGMYNLKNLHYSISWHPRTAHEDYGWHIGYENLLRLISQN